MEHGAYLVDILDKNGAIVGQKERRLIDKQADIYHSVYIILVTPKGELVLGTIPAREISPIFIAAKSVPQWALFAAWRNGPRSRNSGRAARTVY